MNFIIRLSKVNAVEPMQSVGAADDGSQDRFKIHLDSGQEIIVNRVTAEPIIKLVDAANAADVASWTGTGTYPLTGKFGGEKA